MEENNEIIIRPSDVVLDDDKDNLVKEYINPDPKCICCNIPKVSLKINEAYLDGLSYQEIIDKFGVEVFNISQKKLTKKVLSEHFTKHFNFKGSAIAAYNRKKGMNSLAPVEQTQMVSVFDALTTKRINDLELLDLTMQENIKRLQELEDLKKDRIKNKRTYNIEQLIMRQVEIQKIIQEQVLSKLKLWKSSQLQNKQMELMERQLQFLDKKTASFLGLQQDVLEPALAKEAERLYLEAVITNLLKPVRATLERVFKPDTSKIAHFFKELKKKFKNLEDSINDDYQKKIKNLKRVE